MNKLMRIIAAVIALVMAAAAFAACATPDTPQQDTTVPSANTTEAAPETENPYDKDGYLKDKIPEDLKLNTTIRMLYWSDFEHVEFFVEQETGEAVSDAIYTRNLTVNDRLGCDFDYVGTPGNYNKNADYLNFVKNAYNGGEHYDIYAAYSMTTANVAYNGYARNLTQYDILDFSAPWWPEKLISEAAYKGKLYVASGDISTNLLYMMYTFFFNTDMLKDNNLEIPYDLIDRNEWTFDKLIEMTSVMGTPDAAQPYYGLVLTSNIHINAFSWAAGLRVLDRSATGDIVISDTFTGEKMEDVASWTQSFLHQPMNKSKDSTKFEEGAALFTVERARYANRKLSTVDFDYGICPMPKWNADQEKYVTCMAFPFTLYAISTTSEHPEAVAAALECMASESYRKVTPALFELTMKYKYSKESKAAEMFDIIRETVVFDIGRLFCSNLDNISYSLFRNTCDGDTYASILKRYKGFKTAFEDNVTALNTVLDGLE